MNPRIYLASCWANHISSRSADLRMRVIAPDGRDEQVELAICFVAV